MASTIAKRYKIPYGIVAMPSVGHDDMLKLLEQHAGAFTHLLIIPELFDFSTMQVPSRDVGGVLGLEVRQQLLLRGPCLAKRMMDIVLTIAGGICILPLLALIAILIKFDSKGPVFYIQERLGKNGSRFRAVKFRTMFGDGEKLLREMLDKDPALAAEYNVFHKLKNDPRVTRVGRVLRKYSLDEFPQLWNVLRGEMSLVGPRPYLEREIPEMNEREAIILKAPPGMTGMWQVSVRNETAFTHRLKMDVYYVRNWCPWLDLYLLAKTFQVVIRGTGS
jgi:Undecaprenyl-phosphate galactose phosphotransferase WbaP